MNNIIKVIAVAGIMIGTGKEDSANYTVTSFKDTW